MRGKRSFSTQYPAFLLCFLFPAATAAIDYCAVSATPSEAVVSFRLNEREAADAPHVRLKLLRIPVKTAAASVWKLKNLPPDSPEATTFNGSPFHLTFREAL
jgi:hypothetical protein